MNIIDRLKYAWSYLRTGRPPKELSTSYRCGGYTVKPEPTTLKPDIRPEPQSSYEKKAFESVKSIIHSDEYNAILDKIEGRGVYENE